MTETIPPWICCAGKGQLGQSCPEYHVPKRNDAKQPAAKIICGSLKNCFSPCEECSAPVGSEPAS